MSCFLFSRYSFALSVASSGHRNMDARRRAGLTRAGSSLFCRKQICSLRIRSDAPHAEKQSLFRDFLSKVCFATCFSAFAKSHVALPTFCDLLTAFAVKYRKNKIKQNLFCDFFIKVLENAGKSMYNKNTT